MSGELDFTQALIQRVQLLAGLDSAVIEKVRKEITLMPGAEQLIERLHEQGHKVGVVSGGFIDVIEPLLKSLKLDFYRANQLEIKDGKLTGGLLGQVIDRKAKKNALEEFASLENVSISQSVAVGDGANDLDMIEAAGLGVAFNAKPKVAAAAATTISNYDLSTLLLLMGISS
jgi:phosphoserine phosphatase